MGEGREAGLGGGTGLALSGSHQGEGPEISA